MVISKEFSLLNVKKSLTVHFRVKQLGEFYSKRKKNMLHKAEIQNRLRYLSLIFFITAGLAALTFISPDSRSSANSQPNN